MGIALFIAIIFVVIFVHELGHYWVARAYGVKIDEFALGMGSTLYSRTSKRGEKWSLRLIPVGGYVAMDKESHLSSSPMTKFVIALAGPMANILPIMVAILLIGGTEKFNHIVGILGHLYLLTIGSVIEVALSPFVAIYEWFVPAVEAVSAAAENEMVGPIGIAQMTGSAVKESGFLAAFALMFFVLSMGIGLFNLLPFAPLDGGHMVLALADQFFGESANTAKGIYTTVTGIFILWVIVVIVLREIIGLF